MQTISMKEFNVSRYLSRSALKPLRTPNHFAHTNPLSSIREASAAALCLVDLSSCSVYKGCLYVKHKYLTPIVDSLSSRSY